MCVSAKLDVNNFVSENFCTHLNQERMFSNESRLQIKKNRGSRGIVVSRSSVENLWESASKRSQIANMQIKKNFPLLCWKHICIIKSYSSLELARNNTFALNIILDLKIWICDLAKKCFIAHILLHRFLRCYRNIFTVIFFYKSLFLMIEQGKKNKELVNLLIIFERSLKG